MDDENDDWFSEIPEEERVTDAEVARVVEPLLQDVRTTLGPDHERVVVSNAQRLREFLPISLFEQQVVDDVQQEIHDDFIDTSWPACPLHPHHPLWYRDGFWWCEHDQTAFAALGELRP